jgi:hypothetical protein
MKTVKPRSFLFLLLLLGASCGVPVSPKAPAARHLCGADAGYAVCPEGTRCREGQCWAPCKVDTDCPSGEYCDPSNFCAQSGPRP